MNDRSNLSESSHLFGLLSWNIQVGHDKGLLANGWPKRKALVVEQISKLLPDVICLQEPVWEQLTYIQQALRHFDYIGWGRDDGGKRGEFCPILIDTRKFAVSNSGTFWLSDTPEQCHNSWDFPYQRICTWAQVNDLGSGSSFFVFNSHFPLNPGAHQRSAKLIADKKLELCGSSPCFIAADFNCDPNMHPKRALESVGMRNCATPFGKGEDRTIKLLGKPFACVDAVFASTDISVDSYEIVGNRSGPYASDHYGIFVRSRLPDQ